MKISIIVPAYNVEKFLPVCLDSVLAQSYRDWEVLLIDDGSTDKTAALCDQYGKRDSRIRVWHNQNQGLSDTRQFALGFAAGEYVLCLDSDDCIHPEYLERAAAHTEGNLGVIIQMGYTCVPENFTEYGKEYRAEGTCQKWSPMQAIRNIDEDENDRIDRVGTCVVWGKLYPRELFEKVSFPKHVRLHEDQRINHRLFAESQGVIFDPAEMYFYRTRDESLIHKTWKPQRLYIVECYLDRLDCVKAYGDTQEGKRLIELVYRRLLICIIRNFAQMRRNLCGEERKVQSRRLLGVYRQVWQENRDVFIPGKKKMVLRMFLIFPRLTAQMFLLRDRR